MLKDYKFFKSPFKIDLVRHTEFYQMDREEAEKYLIWFLSFRDERIKIFKDVIKSENLKLAEMLDYDPPSLIPLGEWLAKHITRKSQSTDEFVSNVDIAQTAKAKRLFGDISQHQHLVLTEESISLATDTGIYFSKVLEKNIKELNWAVDAGPGKNYYGFNQPVLQGKVEKVNPIWIAHTFVAGLADGKKSPVDLKKLYDFWSVHLQRNKNQIAKYAREQQIKLFGKPLKKKK